MARNRPLVMLPWWDAREGRNLQKRKWAIFKAPPKGPLTSCTQKNIVNEKLASVIKIIIITVIKRWHLTMHCQLKPPLDTNDVTARFPSYHQTELNCQKFDISTQTFWRRTPTFYSILYVRLAHHLAKFGWLAFGDYRERQLAKKL